MCLGRKEKRIQERGIYNDPQIELLNFWGGSHQFIETIRRLK